MTEVSSLEPLKGLTALQELNVSGTKVSNLEPVYGLQDLKIIASAELESDYLRRRLRARR
jgi:Leucine-rich repeat (LRR) protein